MVCESGTCGQATDEGCTGNGDCGQDGVCEEGLCTYAPTCQRLTGTFNAHLACNGGETLEGTATATTTDCDVALAFTFDDGATATLDAFTIAAARAEPNDVNGVCSGTFAAQDGSLVAPGCSTTVTRGGVDSTTSCEVVIATSPLCDSTSGLCADTCVALAADDTSTLRSCP